MKAIRNLLLVMLLMTVFYAVGDWIYAGDGIKLRIQGTATTANTYTVTTDSSDSFGVDTIASDTFKFEDNSGFWDYNYLHVMLIRDTVILCDSCNDSVVVQTQLWTRDKSGYSYQLAADDQAADLTNDTASLRLYINGDSQVPHPDSTVRDWFWVTTIISDSVITDKAVTGTDYKARYYLWFTK